MGCFDIYCNVCHGPFTNYNSWGIKELQGIDTAWLTDAIIEYHDTNNKVQVCYYDGYGRFENAEGEEFDVVEKLYMGEVKVYHKLCENRVVDTHTRNKMKSYQEQFFDIDTMIAHGDQTHLETPK